MYKFKSHSYIVAGCLGLAVVACKAPAATEAQSAPALPSAFVQSTDTTNMATKPWHLIFKDPNLASLIDVAIKNNQEMQITLQEIEIARNEVRARKGELLPTVGIGAGAGVEKVGRYTSQGAGDATTDITPGTEFPEPLPDFKLAAYAHWEADIWKKLRNAKKAALTRYLASIEGKNFVMTNLIAEVANSYYELLALDSQLAIVRQTITLQNNALEIVKVQKEAARATELAVQKFEAEKLDSQNKEYEILQQITETENRINFLLARYPQPIARAQTGLPEDLPLAVQSGIPAQLLENRPDIRQAELELAAAKLDVKVARAAFYPSLDISGSLGLQAFKPSYFFKFPESVLYSLGADIAGPLINRNAIKAEFNSANARQLQALYNYQRVVLNAYLEVANTLSRVGNLEKSYELKTKQVAALNTSINVANDLFRSARADYFEVLMTQRDALESKLELVETRKAQCNALVEIYRDLGGGWR